MEYFLLVVYLAILSRTLSDWTIIELLYNVEMHYDFCISSKLSISISRAENNDIKSLTVNDVKCYLSSSRKLGNCHASNIISIIFQIQPHFIWYHPGIYHIVVATSWQFMFDLSCLLLVQMMRSCFLWIIFCLALITKNDRMRLVKIKLKRILTYLKYRENLFKIYINLY